MTSAYMVLCARQDADPGVAGMHMVGGTRVGAAGCEQAGEQA